MPVNGLVPLVAWTFVNTMMTDQPNPSILLFTQVFGIMEKMI